MKLLLKLVLLVISNAIALWAATKIVPGFTLEITIKNLAMAGAVLGLINMIVRPLVKLISLPLIVLTLGLFTIVVNIAMLWLVTLVFDFFIIESFWAGMWGAFVISLVNYIVSLIFKD